MSWAIVGTPISAPSNDTNNVPLTSYGDTSGADVLLMWIGYYGLGTPPVPKDSKTNTWAPVRAANDAADTNHAAGRWFYVESPVVGSSHTFGTQTGAGAYCAMLVFALSGSIGASPVDTSNHNEGLGLTVLTTGSVTPGNAAYAAFASLTFTASNTPSIGSSFTLGPTTNFSAGVNDGVASAYKLGGLGGTETPQWAFSTSDAAAQIVVLKSSTGTPVAGATIASGATVTAPSVAVGATTVTGTTIASGSAVNAPAVDDGSSPVTVAITDTAIIQSPANWVAPGDGTLNTIEVGAWLQTQFTGDRAKLNVDVAALTGGSVAALDYPTIIYGVDLDYETQLSSFTRYQLKSTDTQITMASSLTDTTHTLMIMIVGMDWDSYERWTNPVMLFKVTGIEVAPGRTCVTPTQNPSAYSRDAIVFSDSFGAGEELVASSVSVAHMNTSLSMAMLIGKKLQARIGNVSHSGQGYTATGGGSIPTLINAYNLNYATKTRVYPRTPYRILSFHGQNDSGTADATLRTAVTAWIAAVRADLPTTRIDVCIPAFLTKASAITNGESDAADANSFLINHNVDLSGSYAQGSHINAAGHVEWVRLLQALMGLVEDVTIASGAVLNAPSLAMTLYATTIASGATLFRPRLSGVGVKGPTGGGRSRDRSRAR